MRVIDAENPDSLLDPKLDNALQFFPKRSPMWRFEFEGIYVLIFFRRIFRVLNRSIRPPSKPFRMLPDVRVIRRALIGEIKRNIDPPAFRSRYKSPKTFQTPNLGRTGHVSGHVGTD